MAHDGIKTDVILPGDRQSENRFDVKGRVLNEIYNS